MQGLNQKKTPENICIMHVTWSLNKNEKNSLLKCHEQVQSSWADTGQHKNDNNNMQLSFITTLNNFSFNRMNPIYSLDFM